MVLAACAGSTSTPAPAPSTPSTPAVPIDRPLVVHGELTNWTNDFINPIWTVTGGMSSMYQYAWMPLGKANADWTWVPWLAKSWSMTDDCKTVDIELHAGAKWSDGQPLTTADVEFSYKLYMHPKINNATGWIIAKVGNIEGAKEFKAGTANQISGINVINTEKMQITLNPADCQWLNDQHLSVAGIQPKHILEKEWDKFNSPETMNQIPYLRNPDVFSGVYALEKVELGQFVQWKRYDSWWAQPIHGFPEIKTVIQRPLMGNPQTMESQLQAGEMHIGLVRPSERARFEAMTNVRLIQQPMLGIQGYRLNQNNPNLASKEARQAIDYAIDKKAIRDTVNYGLGKDIATTIIGREWAMDPNIKSRPYDEAKAKQMLAATGFDFSKPLIYLTQTKDANAELVQGLLKRVGIDVEIRVREGAGFTAAFNAGEYDLVPVQGGPFAHHPQASCSYFNRGVVQVREGMIKEIPRLTELCTEIGTKKDQAAQAPLAKEMQAILFDNVVWIIWAQQELLYAIDTRLDGYISGPGGASRATDSLFNLKWKN
jgi:peptide/nickel transport system substrate-binding protein